MTSPHPICLASQWLLRRALNFAPASLRDWDQAMLAEMGSIDQPLDALQWSLGCLFVVARENVASVFLGVGDAVSELWSFRKEEGRAMRNAKIAAAAVVAATLVLFLATSFRQAMTVAAETLFSISSPRLIYGINHSPLLDQLRMTAEQSGDAKTLAYLALHEQRPEIAQASAERAVAIDPQWTWVYYLLANRWKIPDHAKLIARLQQWDPQNAAVYLVEADHVASKGYYRPIVGNEPWLQMVARAFDAPKFDSYVQQHFNLEREIALQRGSSDPFQIIGDLRIHWISGLYTAQRYAIFVLGAPNRSPEEAVRQARHIAAFGERLTAENMDMERLIGANIALAAYKKLDSLVSPDERATIAVRIEQLRSMQQTSWRNLHLIGNYPSWWEGLGFMSQISRGDLSSSSISAGVFAFNATVVQICLLLIIAAVFVLAGSTLALAFGRRRGMNILMWAASGTLLIASTVGYVAYLPFVRLSTELANPRISVDESLLLSRAFLSFSSTPLLELRHRLWVPIYGWTSLIVFLVLALAWIAARHLYQILRRRPIVPAT